MTEDEERISPEVESVVQDGRALEASATPDEVAEMARRLKERQEKRGTFRRRKNFSPALRRALSNPPRCSHSRRISISLAAQKRQREERRLQKKLADAAAVAGTLCYFCGAKAITSIERVHTVTGRLIRVLYCGRC